VVFKVFGGICQTVYLESTYAIVGGALGKMGFYGYLWVSRENVTMFLSLIFMSNSQWERANQFGILLGSELPHFLFVGS
jgi:hypothetical protein